MTHYLRLFLFAILVASCNPTKLQKRRALHFIPENYVLYQQFNADLNNDGKEDCILLIKDTNPEHIVVNRFDKTVDRNRRGIIILFKTNNSYQLIDKNIDCFYSENEDGGVYFAPQLSVTIDQSDIIFNFEHGRYGYWSYRFSYRNKTYQLIQYKNVSSSGPKINSEVTVDFLTKQKIIRTNINEDDDGNNPIFKETITNFNLDQLIQLSTIKTFEDLQF